MDSRPGDTYRVGSERFSASAVGLSRGGAAPRSAAIYVRDRPPSVRLHCLGQPRVGLTAVRFLRTESSAGW